MLQTTSRNTAIALAISLCLSLKETAELLEALAISLCLSLKETAELLETAGFALSHSSKADLIIEYFIVNSIWRLADINDALYSFGEEPISV